MIIIDEERAKSLLGPAEALAAVRHVLVAMAEGSARNFPVVRERLPETNGTYGVKSGVDMSGGLVGLKAGGYWPGNEARGIKNHQSTTLLCDAASGEPVALVAANYLTALRTAAAAAVATDALGRTSVETLSIIGAGAQALPQIAAQAGVRSFRRVVVASRNRARAEAVAEAATAFVSQAEACDFQVAAEAADVLTTVTPAAEPVVRAEWIRPGTHINAMGADTAGKGELEPSLLPRARVFYDEWQQACTIGECQKAVALGLLGRDVAAGPLGDVLRGAIAGRQAEEDITLFDSTGVALQDIAVAALALDRVRGQERSRSR
ncbi:ornithine cyclodeaminase family protein [Lutibaculum baratangense]|uniref:Ornithine cyclodeaminase n=1 Tax=Lutibaculum baratangense AMV1 TaxID=631454 RepID=V4TG05_9HYPH|nr:ornithine cyclodeaminase family protein [Lutibaculum baratangense]ESR25058.1 Ornithine cyclodeaminase [Lutibaculum baratangense AMV1]